MSLGPAKTYSASMEFPTTSQSRRSAARSAHPQGEMVLLKVMVGTREGWGVMALDEFLHKLDLQVWRADERLFGTILPQMGGRTLN